MASPLTGDQLLRALRAEGLTVHEYPGWRDRCRCHSGSHQAGGPTIRAWGPIYGTMIHITAGGLNGRSVQSYIRDIINGDPYLPSKSQLVIAPNGDVWLNSFGRCNHAGSVSSRGLNAVANGKMSLTGYEDIRGSNDDGNRYLLGIENIAARSMTTAQRRSSVLACAAHSRAQGWDGRDDVGHGEIASSRSYSDPNLNMGAFRRDVMAQVKAGPSLSKVSAKVSASKAPSVSKKPSPSKGTDMPTPKDLWNWDGIPAPDPKAANKYWMPKNYLREIYRLLLEIRTLVKANK